jgi:4-hydroxybutyrate CoA-transferase
MPGAVTRKNAMDWRKRYREKITSAEQAVGVVKSHDRVIINLGGEPRHCLSALARRAKGLRGVKLACSWVYDHPWFHPGLEESFDVRATFTTKVTRQAIHEKRVDWIPWLPGLGDRDRSLEPGRGTVQQNADVAFIVVTPPDEEGYCSFGNQMWNGPNAARSARVVVAEVNGKMPFTFGDNLHVSKIDFLVEAPPEAVSTSVPGTEWTSSNVEEWEKAQVIAAAASELIRDGDTFQVGIGVPSESVINYLEGKNDLGVDTEVIYPQIIELVKKGIITGDRKNINPGKVLATAAWIVYGHPKEKETVEYLDRNPRFEFRDFSTICNVPRIAANDHMVTVNTILGIDLLGQAMVDYLGDFPIAGQGGQMEFCIGSHYSRGGRSISCLLSSAKRGTISRVVPQFEKGTGVGIPMGYLDYLVTEHGAVNLEYKTRRERAAAIISVADPAFRDELTAAAKALF